MLNNTTDFLDEARDWVSTNHPELEGDEFEQAVYEAAKDIASLYDS